MKRFVLMLLLCLTVASPLYADYADGRSERGPLGRVMEVEGRGLLNAVGLPFEITGTFVSEVRTHHWLFPATYPPRVLQNFILRTASIINDIFIYPWIALGTDDISPWTEPMGLPEYPWQPRHDSF